MSDKFNARSVCDIYLHRRTVTVELSASLSCLNRLCLSVTFYLFQEVFSTRDVDDIMRDIGASAVAFIFMVPSFAYYFFPIV